MMAYGMKLFLIMLSCAGCACAGEYAVLSSGARIHAERHEMSGATVTLFDSTGSTELNQAMVVGFEQEEYVAPKPADPPPTPAHADATDVKALADNAAIKYGLPAALVRAVVAAESGYRVDAVSPKGAIGLMQLMPSTARELGADPYVAAENVDAGARYLRNLLLKYDGHAYHALAAYNAGPGAVDKYHGVPPYRETQAYILNVLRQWRKQQQQMD
jgi:soluble lytic murein transglycosylase-like protein